MGPIGFRTNFYMYSRVNVTFTLKTNYDNYQLNV